MKVNEPIIIEQPAVCKDSWWVGVDRQQFTMRRLLREEVLKAAFGSAPVSTVPSAAEATFMDKKR